MSCPNSACRFGHLCRFCAALRAVMERHGEVLARLAAVPEPSYVGKTMRVEGMDLLHWGVRIAYEDAHGLYSAEPNPGATYIRVDKILLDAPGRGRLEIYGPGEVPPGMVKAP